MKRAKIVFIIFIASFGLIEPTYAFCPPGRVCVVQAPAPVRVSPQVGYSWNPRTPPTYYQQQNQMVYQQGRQVYQQYQRNPYATAARLAWSGVTCAGGALVAVGTDGAGLPIMARTGYACTQAGVAAWQYGQALGR